MTCTAISMDSRPRGARMSAAFTFSIRWRSSRRTPATERQIRWSAEGVVVLKKTRQIWKRRLQARLFDVAGMQGLLDEQERHALEDHMGFRGQLIEHRRFQIEELKKLGLQSSQSVLE